MENCIFCRLAKGEIPSQKVVEDENTVAFLELKPSAPGHLMVIHKKHGLSVLDYNKDELGDIMVTVREAAKKLKKVFDCDSITIGINHLERRGVPHLHVHLMPRWESDQGGHIQTLVKNPPKESQEVVAEKIRNA